MTGIAIKQKLLVALLLASTVSYVVAAELPNGTFALGAVTLGFSTLTDVKNKFGPASEGRTGGEEESDLRICYCQTPSSSKAALVAFDSGPMGGFSAVTAFELAEANIRGPCAATRIDIRNLSTANGLRLGQALEEFKKIVGVALRQKGNQYSFEGQSRREMTVDEKARLRSQSTSSRDTYFDVTMRLNAEFHGGRLIRLRVERFESN